MYFPLVLDKNIIYVDAKTSGMKDELNIENYKGHEFNFRRESLLMKLLDPGDLKILRNFMILLVMILLKI